MKQIIMPYIKQGLNFESLEKWDWKAQPELECTLIRTRQGTGKAEGLVFHEVEEYTTGEKFSLLGSTVLDRIFEEAGNRRVKIISTGLAKGKNNRSYRNFEWYLWEE